MNPEKRLNSMAQLSTWTEIMRQEQAKSKQREFETVEEEYEEEFEDYDEEFEEAEEERPPVKLNQPAEPKNAPSNTSSNLVKNIPSKSTKATAPDSSSTQSHHDHARDGKPAVQAPPKSGFDGFNVSMLKSMTDPRSHRLEKLLKSNVMDLQLDKKQRLFQMNPSTLYDLYCSELRKGTGTNLPNLAGANNSNNAATNVARIRQIGVPLDLETREMEVNTEVIETAEKSIQFTFDDDSDFLRTLEEVQNRKKGLDKLPSNSNADLFRGKAANNLANYTSSNHESNEENKSGQESTENASSSAKISDDTINEGSAASLYHFLHNALELFEEEMLNVQEKNADSKDSSNNNSTMNYLGGEKSSGSIELLKARHCNLVAFNGSNEKHLFVTSHPCPQREEELETDLRPYKGLFAVWDIFSTAQPLYILECNGVASALAVNNVNIVAVGCDDGVIYMYDLSESSTQHNDKDSIELKITNGIRKPSYSTAICGNFIDSAANSGVIESEFHSTTAHTSKVLQIICIDESESSNKYSQFLTVDEEGVIIQWAAMQDTSSTASNALTNNLFDLEVNKEKLQKNIQSQIILVAMRRTNSAHLFSSMRYEGQSNTLMKVSRSSAHSTSNTFLGVLTDNASMLVGSNHKPAADSHNSSNHAVIYKVDRTSNTSAAHRKYLPATGQTSVENRIVAISSAEISNISVSISADEPQHRALRDKLSIFLVGRDGGVVDLYTVDQSLPLLSWKVSALDHSIRAQGKQDTRAMLKKSPEIIAMKFLSVGSGREHLDGREALEDVQHLVFGVVTRAGVLHIFDLLADIHHPVLSQAIGVSSLVAGTVDLKYASGSVRVVVSERPTMQSKPARTSGKKTALPVAIHRVPFQAQTYRRDINSSPLMRILFPSARNDNDIESK